MNRPLIGISGSHNVADRQMFVRENYMQSVLRAGGIPVLLPEIEDEETAKAILDRLDGLLLAGGGDVLPSRYGEETLPACGEDDPQRDIFELLIIPMAIARNMPIFGICRGIQVLNVAMGGTLIQDIESQQNIPKKTHQQEPPFSQPLRRWRPLHWRRCWKQHCRSRSVPWQKQQKRPERPSGSCGGRSCSGFS